MTEPTACCAARCPVQPYCGNCDLLVGLQGLHVLEVQRGPDQLRVTVESEPSLMGCPACGVVAVSHGRRDVLLIDAPSFGRPVRLVWRKRTWCCLEPLCPAGTFTEQHHDVAAPRALLTVRACWWAITQLRREHASISGLARQLGTSWRTVWRAIRPLLQAMDADPTRFEAVTTLGVDEHIWHHVSITERGPKELTGMVDLTRDEQGNTRARLLDLVPGRSGAAYGDWLTQRGQAFRDRVEVATLDPFHGYKNAIDDRLQDAIAVVDAFHLVKLAGHAVDEVRRRVQQETLGHRGRSGDPLYGIRNILRCGQDRLTERQRARLDRAITADERHEEVHVAWQAVQRLRSVFHQDTPEQGRRIAEHVVTSFPSCPIPEIARLGRTLRQWREPFLAYFQTAGASNGGTEAINGLIELHRRVARGFRNRDNYRLRMLLIGGGLTDPRIS
jgi:transposase